MQIWAQPRLRLPTELQIAHPQGHRTALQYPFEVHAGEAGREARGEHAHESDETVRAAEQRVHPAVGVCVAGGLRRAR